MLGAGPALVPTASAAPRSARRARTRSATRAKPSAPERALSRTRRRKGAKRDPKVVEVLTARAAAWIKSNPGKRMEELGVGLKTRTSELTVPVATLRAAKRIKKSGQARGTKYVAA